MIGILWLLFLARWMVLAHHLTFNVHYFFFVVLVLEKHSLPYLTEMMLIIVNDKGFAFFYSTQEFWIQAGICDGIILGLWI
jgi:hypothetical protein